MAGAVQYLPLDGSIDSRRIRRWCKAAGFAGVVEVEKFSARNWWRQSAEPVLATILERYRTVL